VKIGGDSVVPNDNLDDFKKKLMNDGPLCIGVDFGTYRHAMSLIG
jgi:hypothetical protein